MSVQPEDTAWLAALTRLTVFSNVLIFTLVVIVDYMLIFAGQFTEYNNLAGYHWTLVVFGAIALAIIKNANIKAIEHFGLRVRKVEHGFFLAAITYLAIAMFCMLYCYFAWYFIDVVVIAVISIVIVHVVRDKLTP